MAEVKIPVVYIRYKSEYGTSPEETQILATDPLTLAQLPTLSGNDYKFVGWVHVNPDGHESSLSERMILSTDWLIPANVENNEYYVIFTAKWVNDRTSSTGDTGTGGGGENTPPDIPVMTESTIGGAKLGNNLKISATGHLYVDTADAVEKDNTKPITSAAVHVVVGNIDVLLGTI